MVDRCSVAKLHVQSKDVYSFYQKTLIMHNGFHCDIFTQMDFGNMNSHHSISMSLLMILFFCPPGFLSVGDKRSLHPQSTRDPGILNMQGPLLKGGNTCFPPMWLRVNIVNNLVIFLLLVESDRPHPPFAIKTNLTQIPQNVYPRLSLPRYLSLAPS